MFRHPFGTMGMNANEMERLRREMNRLFSNLPARTEWGAPTYPAMNVWTNEEGAVVTAEVPGVNPEDLDISVVGDTLTVSGKRDSDTTEEDVRYHRRERGQGAFKRSFQLPFTVEAGKVEADFENGVLHITLPRAEADKPRKITVKAA